MKIALPFLAVTACLSDAAPLLFERNAGQFDPAVRFAARAGNQVLLLTDDEALLRLRSGAVRLRFGGRGGARGERLVAGKSNYLVGNDPGRWVRGVPNFSAVRYPSVWNGIDLVFYGNGRQLEFDFDVSPGADPGAIRFVVGGDGKPELQPDGDIAIPVGTERVLLHKPRMFQRTGGGPRSVGGGYRIKGGKIGFRVGAYDPRLPLVIDPVMSFALEIGGGGDLAQSVAFDVFGNVYLTGNTESLRFPVKNALQAEHAPGVCGWRSPIGPPIGGPCPDAFVTKLDPSGALIYSTYLGGSRSDYGHAIAVDALGNAHVAGRTESLDFPTVNAFRSSPAYGFVAKLDPSGARLVYSTYFTGDPGAIAVDMQGSAVVTGSTADDDFPVIHAFQPGLAAATVFRSDDGGATWRAINNRMTTAQALALAPSDPNTLYGWSSSLWKTSDGGTTWTRLLGRNYIDSLNPPQSRGITAAAVDPGTPMTVYVGFIGGVLKSTDGGMSWTRSSLGPLDDGPLTLLIDPRNSSTVYAGGRDGIYKSADGGVTWQRSSITPAGTPAARFVETVLIDPGNAAVLYAAAKSGVAAERGVLKSTDSGASWKWINSGIDTSVPGRLSLAIDPRPPSTLYVSVGDRIWRSREGGESWRLVNGVLGFWPEALAVDPVMPSALYASAGLSVFKTLDGGVTWREVATLPGAIITLAIQPLARSTVYAAVSGSNINDAFVTKLSPAGAPVYSTYLGGGGAEVGTAISVASPGNVYIAGYTTSTDFPTVNALQPQRGGGDRFAYDAFVAELSADGSRLVYSTYLGGSGWDQGNALAVDAAGNAYVAGVTGSADFPRAAALQPGLQGASDAFVAKIGAGGGSLVYSTYLGGSGTDTAYGIGVDRTGAAYIAGATDSRDFPVAGSLLSASAQGGPDAFITKIAPSGNALVYSGYLGGSSSDMALAIAVDRPGTAYAAGYTTSPNFPATGSIGLPAASAATSLSFLVKIAADLGNPSANAVVDAASYRNPSVGIAPGSIVAIFGTDFTAAAEGAASVPLPGTLRDVSVTFNGVAAPLFYVSNEQINVQAPFELAPGSAVEVRVKRGDAVAAARRVPVVDAAPGIFTSNAQGTGPGAILHADLSPISEASPAHPGDFVAVYCTGLGRVQQPVPTGQGAGVPPPETLVQPEVTIAGKLAAVTWSGLAPYFVGLYQVNVQVPGDTPAGAQPLQMSAGGVGSNTVTIAVR